MEKEYLIIDNHLSKNGNVTTEFKESDGKLIVKQFSGTNTDNFIIKKFNNKRLEFSVFKLNGIYYININSFHIPFNFNIFLTHNFATCLIINNKKCPTQIS